MEKKLSLRHIFSSDIAIISYLALGKLFLHLAVAGNYGYFRDELYYISCSKHLALGYVDHPPLSIFLLAMARFLFGDSLFSIRLFSSLAGASFVFFTGLIARELGGKIFSQITACVSVIVAGTYLSMNSFYSMNALDYLFWAMGTYIVIRIIKTHDDKLWMGFGIVVGLGLLNKYSMLFFVAGLLAGILFTSHRKEFLNKWFWIGGFIAFIIFLPHIIWQILNGYPSLEFMRNASQYKNLAMTPLSFLLGQVFTMNTITAPIWLFGLYYYFFKKEGRPYRLFGWIFVVVFIIMITSKAKLYYFAPAFFIVFASGSVLLEKLLRKIRWNWPKPILMTVITIIMITRGVNIAPFTIPVLTVENFIKYAESKKARTTREEVHELGVLPQHFSDMFGWEKMAATIAGVYTTLTGEERSQCVIYARNYGEAGAINFFGEKYGLPRAICGHNSFWLWGPGNRTGKTTIFIGRESNIKRSYDDLKQHYDSVEHVATLKCNYCMQYENNVPVFVCRRPNFSFQKEWLHFKSYI